MIKVKSRAELYPPPKLVAKEPIEPVRHAVSDVVNTALQSLALAAEATLSMIAHVSDAQKATGEQLIELAKERKPPIRLEASIKRDKAGKMTSITITPIHK